MRVHTQGRHLQGDTISSYCIWVGLSKNPSLPDMCLPLIMYASKHLRGFASFMKHVKMTHMTFQKMGIFIFIFH